MWHHPLLSPLPPLTNPTRFCPTTDPLCVFCASVNGHAPPTGSVGQPGGLVGAAHQVEGGACSLAGGPGGTLPHPFSLSTLTLPSLQTTVDHMTQVLCQVLYSLDPKSLPLEQVGRRPGPRTQAMVSSQRGASLSQPEREAVPPPSPSARLVGRRRSFRRQRQSQVEHPIFLAPVHSPTLAKATSTSENILDQSFDIPSPTSSTPCESASVASFREKSITPIRQVARGTGTFPQSSLPVSTFLTPSLPRCELSPAAGKLRKAVSEHVLSTGSWAGQGQIGMATGRARTKSPEVVSLLESCQEASPTGQGVYVGALRCGVW